MSKDNRITIQFRDRSPKIQIVFLIATIGFEQEYAIRNTKLDQRESNSSGKENHNATFTDFASLRQHFKADKIGCLDKYRNRWPGSAKIQITKLFPLSLLERCHLSKFSFQIPSGKATMIWL